MNTFNFSTTEQDEMVNKYNRVLTSSLLALRKLITVLPANQIEDLKHLMNTLLKDGKFWKHGKSTITSVSGSTNALINLDKKSQSVCLLTL